MTDPTARELELRIEALKELILERLDGMSKALELQAEEYERRLNALNHAHEQAIEVQHTYVTADKYEDKLASESQARDAALLRVDEKFQEYVKRYEVRQREVDQALSIMRGAAEQAQRAVEDQARKTNRNLAVATAIIIVLVAIANYLGTI